MIKEYFSKKRIIPGIILAVAGLSWSGSPYHPIYDAYLERPLMQIRANYHNERQIIYLEKDEEIVRELILPKDNLVEKLTEEEIKKNKVLENIK